MRVHEHVPHFEVITIGGERVRYGNIWQHQPLVLVCLPDRAKPLSNPERTYVADVEALGRSGDAAVVVTRGPIDRMPAPGVLVADQWGEIFFLSLAASIDQFPPATEIEEWLRWVQMKCPECEGESK